MRSVLFEHLFGCLFFTGVQSGSIGQIEMHAHEVNLLKRGTVRVGAIAWFVLLGLSVGCVC